ncbi:protoporphyrinogen oxidase [Chlamydia felis Fe/C-56]|uniref:Coproporphyrinogen III oxidase n=1 Tax=Chlamydia felis (strain Fe/C-56) TaxID=264202 RepID=Q255Y0_CHLFF|nr:protoporphyrinogen oxidase [Chlamydia felis]BAE80908.1 protoporphyrinogen oxidase [Chlamydia felis Fe/C-56]
MKKAIVIGAGISGLSTAWWLHRKFPSIELIIIDKAHRPGGLIYTDLQEDFHLDLGPKGFLVQGEGEYTLKLIHDLGLSDFLIASDKTAKKRFIRYKGKTRKVSPWTLIKEGLPFAIIKDLFASRYTKDNSVYDFLQRHSTTNLIHNVLNPIVTAIRAGRSDVLSAHMAFPTLSQYEATTGSILRGYLKDSSKKKIKNAPYLASLRPNLGILIDTLVKKLPATWKFSSSVTKIDCFPSEVVVSTMQDTFSGDLAIYTGPVSLLPSLIDVPGIQHLAKKTLYWNLSCATLGWDKDNPSIPKGYGMLLSDEPPLLGIVYNSRVFPEHFPGKTVLSLLLENRWHEEEAYAFSLAAISEYLGISKKPDVFSLFSPEEGLPQHCVGFLEMKNRILPSIPHNLKIVGQNFAGPGLNRCVASAYQTIATI